MTSSHGSGLGPGRGAGHGKGMGQECRPGKENSVGPIQGVLARICWPRGIGSSPLVWASKGQCGRGSELKARPLRIPMFLRRQFESWLTTVSHEWRRACVRPSRRQFQRSTPAKQGGETVRAGTLLGVEGCADGGVGHLALIPIGSYSSLPGEILSTAKETSQARGGVPLGGQAVAIVGRVSVLGFVAWCSDPGDTNADSGFGGYPGPSSSAEVGDLVTVAEDVFCHISRRAFLDRSTAQPCGGAGSSPDEEFSVSEEE